MAGFIQKEKKRKLVHIYIHFNVLCLPAPPRMEKSLPDKQVELGDQFKLKIPFSGTGPFEISVLKNGRELKEDARVKVTEFDDYVVLVFKGEYIV